MKGRRPGLATIQRRLAGGYKGNAPECPDWLDDVAKAEWSRLQPELERLGITAIDTMMLASYCRIYSQWVRCEQIVDEQGMLVKGIQGTQQLHPCARQAAKLLAELRRAAGEFGFSPASRTRVEHPVQQDEESKALEIFQQGA